MSQRLESRLREHGCEMDVVNFRDLLAESLHNICPNWNDEELMHNPQEALRYCAEVRTRANCPGLPDDVILRALSGMRKHVER